MTRFAFFLGGHDLEMRTIAALLRGLRPVPGSQVAALHDKGLAWGACASDYSDEIDAEVAAGRVPVLVELTRDIDLPRGTIEIDHHGPRSAEPAALAQVFDLLRLDQALWTRHFALVAANDTGHIRAMRRMGATEAEIAEIRRLDRAAQGITAEEEATGLEALETMVEALDGTLLVIHLPHGRSATVCDPLEIRGETRDLLILSPSLTQFFGRGDRIAALDAAFPGGWRGGELPARGFWGKGEPLARQEVFEVLDKAGNRR